MNPSDSLSISATIRARTFFARSPSSFRWRVISWPGKSFSWMRMTPPLRLTSRVWALWRTATPELENHEASTCSCRLTRSLCRMPSAIMGLMDTWDYELGYHARKLRKRGGWGALSYPLISVRARNWRVTFTKLFSSRWFLIRNFWVKLIGEEPPAPGAFGLKTTT